VKPAPEKAVAIKSVAPEKKAGDKSVKVASVSVTRPAHGGKVDPLAPLPVERSTAKGTRTDR